MRERGSGGAGVVEDDFPAGGFFFEDEGEDAGGIASTSGGAGEVEAAGDDGVIGAEHADVEAGEVKVAHGGRRWVGALVAGEEHGVSMLDGLADEGGAGRVSVAMHEGGDVAAVPGGYLGGEDVADGGVGGLGVESGCACENHGAEEQ